MGFPYDPPTTHKLLNSSLVYDGERSGSVSCRENSFSLYREYCLLCFEIVLALDKNIHVMCLMGSVRVLVQ